VTEAVTDVVSGVLGIGGVHIDPDDTTGPEVPPRVLRDTLGLNSTWAGRGVVVAVIDSGLEMSPEFEGRVLKFYDFTGGRTLQTTAFDDYGHGTHVAGTIGGSGAQSNNREYRGLAPSVKFVVLKALDKTGAGYTSDVIRAVDFAVANRAKLGIDIINLSLGHPIYEPAATDPLVQAVERATRAGLIVVAAAGNLGRNPETGLTGYAGVTSPGNAPSAITTGALQTGATVKRGDDRIPDYSSAGPTWYDAIVKPDLIAPGHNIVAAAAKRGPLYRNYPYLKAADGDYMKLSGTSMATAVTSGVIALMLEAHAYTQGGDAPPLTPNAVKGALQYSAIEVRNDLGIEYDPLRQGAGGLNGRGAIELGRAIDGSAAPGASWLNPSPNPWTVIGGETLLWKQAIIWGSAIVWGSTVPVNHPAWGSAIIWGSQDVWNEAIIWGSSDIVWTDSRAWSSAIIWGSDSVGEDRGSAIIWGSTGGTAETTAWKNLEEQ
jgi:serine protease AprX